MDKTDLLTRKQAGQALGLALRTIDLYIHEGHLRAVRRPLVGRKLGTFIRRREVERVRRALARGALGLRRRVQAIEGRLSRASSVSVHGS